MGWRGTVIAFVLLLVAAGAYFWAEESERGPSRPGLGPEAVGAPTAPPVTPIADFRAADVDGLTLTLDGEARSSTLKDGAWSGAERSQLVADFLADLTSLGVLGEIDAAPDELKDFGLAPCRGRIEAQLRTGRRAVIELGNRNPSTTGIYLRFPDSGRVVLAGALVGWEFEKAFRALATPQPH